MDNTGAHKPPRRVCGASANKLADVVSPDREAFTLKAHWRTGPRTRAWDEMWRWLLDGLDNAGAPGQGLDDGDGMPLDAPPSPAAPDA